MSEHLTENRMVATAALANATADDMASTLLHNQGQGIPKRFAVAYERLKRFGDRSKLFGAISFTFFTGLGLAEAENMEDVAWIFGNALLGTTAYVAGSATIKAVAITGVAVPGVGWVAVGAGLATAAIVTKMIEDMRLDQIRGPMIAGLNQSIASLERQIREEEQRLRESVMHDPYTDTHYFDQKQYESLVGECSPCGG